MITLTRKLFTMLLSVIVYKHKLTPGQWLGTAIVFAGISVEAFVKRKGSWSLEISLKQRQGSKRADNNIKSNHRRARKEGHSRKREGKIKVAVIILEHWTCTHRTS